MNSALVPLEPPTDFDQVADLISQAQKLLGTDPDEANRLAIRACDAVDADSSIRGQALHILGMTECVLGHTIDGRARLLEATDILGRLGPPRASCRAWRDYASVTALLMGDPHAGIPAFEQALALAEELGDPKEQGAVLARLGATLGRAGRQGDACQILERAITLLEQVGDDYELATALDNLGYQLIQQHDYARAVAPLRAEYRLRDLDEDRLHAANCRGNLAIAIAGTGEATEALALIREVGFLLERESNPIQWADYRLAQGTVNLLLKDAEAARGPLQEAVAMSRENGVRLVEADALASLSRAEEQCGNLAGALACERQLRQAERQWLDEQTANRAKTMEATLELAEKRAENQALARARAELEQRVSERTAQLNEQIRERDVAQRQARFWSDHDWLTRLPNRRQMQTLLDVYLQRAIDEGSTLGVLFVDLDGFKAINDAHGHLAGDRLLRLTARRLKSHAEPGAVVTRFGGDEFVVLMPGLAQTADAEASAQRLRAAVLAPMQLDDRMVPLSCSIGVAIGPRDATSPDELLRRADRAMLEAKVGGRNQVRELDAGGQDRLERRGRLRRELGHAIANGRLSAVFQPLWDLRRGELSGVELLARWQDPQLGWVSPADFIPVAEESGQISALGLWAVREAITAALALQAAGLWRQDTPERSGMRVSVNLSTVQLADSQLVNKLLRTVADAGGQPAWLELELTESVQLAEDTVYRDRMRSLHEAGFKLAIDDFGAGYSSFSYLNRAYFDRLKIDRALVSASVEANDRSAVTDSIILMAHRLGLEVVAEGIETPEQIALLAHQNCDVLQGYHIARPMPLTELLCWEPAADLLGHQPR